jgi:anti-sigma B factor antagonist
VAEFRYAIVGDFDLAGATTVRADLRTAIAIGDAHLLVDCARMTFIDSIGVRVLLDAQRVLEPQGRHMLVINVAPQSRRVFEVLGLTELLRYDRQMAISA